MSNNNKYSTSETKSLVVWNANKYIDQLRATTKWTRLVRTIHPLGDTVGGSTIGVLGYFLAEGGLYRWPFFDLNEGILVGRSLSETSEAAREEGREVSGKIFLRI